MQRDATSFGASLTQVIDEKWVPRRYIVLAVAAGIFAWVWLDLSGAAGGTDWSRFMAATRSFNTVPPNGDVVGPLMLVLLYPFTWLSQEHAWIVCSALSMGLGVVTIWCVEQTAEIAGVGSRRARERAVLFGGLFLMYAWALPGARWGHPDDCLAFACIALAGRAVVTRRWLVASLAIAVATDAKLWALLALPLVAACVGTRLRGIVVALVVAAIPWIPFLVAQHGHVGSVNLPVLADSDLRYLGVAGGSTPGWPRALQLAVAWPLGAYAVAKQRWYLVPALAFAVRINLDPVTVPYYTTGAIFGLFVWDVVRPSRVWGGRAALGCIGLALVPSYLYGIHGYGAAGPFVVAARVLLAIPPIVALARRDARATS
jgi:hypothetical protein